jgi:predicted NBD/HSP70 family sugar kinase
MDRALNSEPAARAALVETARFLGVGISNLIKGLSPFSLVLAGKFAHALSD